jgi:hypothetical protein
VVVLSAAPSADAFESLLWLTAPLSPGWSTRTLTLTFCGLLWFELAAAFAFPVWPTTWPFPLPLPLLPFPEFPLLLPEFPLLLPELAWLFAAFALPFPTFPAFALPLPVEPSSVDAGLACSAAEVESTFGLAFALPLPWPFALPLSLATVVSFVLPLVGGVESAAGPPAGACALAWD